MLRTLDADWTLRPVAGPVPSHITAAGPVRATVPGTVHTDLLAAGLIPDPYLDDNERLLAWIGKTTWCYETTFTHHGDGSQFADLVFEGLDTVARIELNGHLLAETFNMHRTYRIDACGALREGVNTLTVTFASAISYANTASMDIGARPHVNHHPYNAIRKMACNFGWDWGPDVVTAGLWRPVALHTWSTVRLAAVRPVVHLTGEHGTVEIHIDLAGRSDVDAQVFADLNGATASASVPAGSRTVVLHLDAGQVRRWWPRGYGEQPLYPLRVTLTVGGGELDTWQSSIGFRTVTLDTSQDEHGTSFTFVVNGQPVFAKGANWIPDDAFPHRVSRSRYAARLAQAEEAGINLLRVWGGGIYESDDFYAECDARGIMTWQDFLFACATYSEEDPMRAEVIAEASDNITRLMKHPSLVLWNGGNENLWGYADWGWPAQLDGQTWGLGYYEEILPRLVADLDPGRPYSPGSPWSPGEARHPNDPAHGTLHIWDVWNRLDYSVYRSYQPRFAAEFGWQGPPAWATLRRAISDEPLTPESPGMLVHQKAAEGNFKLTGGLMPHFRLPSTMDDWHWAMSLNQARALSTAVEYFRSLSPVCSGSVMWQLNDCWPVVSWAAIDGDGRRKPTFYALKHAHAERLLTIQPRPSGGLQVVAVNDTSGPWEETVQVSRRTFDGKTLTTTALPIVCGPRQTVAVALPHDLAAANDIGSELIVAQSGPQRALWFFAEDRDSDLAPPILDTDVTATSDGIKITITAANLVKDLALLADKVDASAVTDGMLRTLLPGESVTWHITTTSAAPAQAWTSPSVLRSANQLVARSTGGV